MLKINYFNLNLFFHRFVRKKANQTLLSNFRQCLQMLHRVLTYSLVVKYHFFHLKRFNYQILHNFRRFYSIIMRTNKLLLKKQQEKMRHLLHHVSIKMN